MTMLDKLLPIGFTLMGKPVYPMSGGSPVGDGEEVGNQRPPANSEEQGDDDDDDQEDDDQRDAGDDDDQDDDDDELGPKGVKALEETRKERDRFKTKTREARDALKPWSDIEKEFGLKPADVRARLQGKVKDAEGREVDVAELRRTMETEIRGEFTTQLVGAQVKAVAAGMLNDSTDAARFLDLNDLDVDSQGNVDPEDITSAIRQLIEDRPYLAKAEIDPTPQRRRGPNGGRGQGSGKGKDDKKSSGSVAAGMELWKQTGSQSKV